MTATEGYVETLETEEMLETFGFSVYRHPSASFEPTQLTSLKSRDALVHVVPGFFSETIKSIKAMQEFPLSSLSFLHIDGDLYKSVATVLEELEPTVTPGGAIVIDDFNWSDAETAKKAALDYRRAKKINSTLYSRGDTRPAWWIK